MDDSDSQILGCLTKAFLCVIRKKLWGGLAELITVHLRPKCVFEIPILEDRGRDTYCHPHKLLHRIDFRRNGYALGTGKETYKHVDLLDIDQALSFANSNIGFTLCVTFNRDNRVTLNSTPLINHINGDLRSITAWNSTCTG